LGDKISAGGGADAAVLARIRSGWAKFNELVPIICGHTMSNKLKGHVYTACVRSVMLYGGETWPLRKELEDKLDKTEMKMIRWMAGVSLKDRKRNQDLRDEFGIDSIGESLTRARLRWMGHVLRKSDNDGVKCSMTRKVVGTRLKGRPRLTWQKTVERDMKLRGLSREDVLDRNLWRTKIWCRPTPASLGKRS